MFFRASLFALLTGLLVLSGGSIGQDNKPKEEPKKDEKKKDEPAPKAKGVLPQNWKKLGLSDSQVQEIYKVQGKYNEEINKLEAKIKELKAAREKEEKAVLTAEQKNRNSAGSPTTRPNSRSGIRRSVPSSIPNGTTVSAFSGAANPGTEGMALSMPT